MPLNPNIFNLNYKKLVVWLLPKPIRKPVQVAWLLALASPVIRLFNEFQAFRQSVIYHLTISPQVCKLEKLLNDRYDTVNRGIWIDDAREYEPLFLYQKAESKPVHLYRKSENKPKYLYTKAETSALGVDFIIYVPVFVVFDINELSSLIKKYKLVSKTFKVSIV